MKRILTHLCLCMSVCMAVIVYIDDRNPMMGFLRSTTGRIYSIAFCLIALIVSILWIADDRKKRKKAFREAEEKTTEEE